MTGRHGDRGQAFPIYVVVVAGLLFAALAFFVVGQASVKRSDAQGAADAAALAAAQEARNNLVPGLDLATLKPEQWEKLLEGGLFDPEGACGKAELFAAKNDATATCVGSPLRYKVDVETKGTVGDSVLPGTGSMHATATATASIVPRCRLVTGPADPAPTPTPGGEVPKPKPIEIKCDTGSIQFDPSKPDPWRTLAQSLFRVRLVD